MRRLFACMLLLTCMPAAAVDLILHNGKLWTGDPARPLATAIAIDDGRILAIGDEASILKLATDDSQRIDLKGRRVVPGINDAHTHFDTGLFSIDLTLPRDADGAAVRKAIAAQPTEHERWLTADIGMQALADPGLRLAALDALQPRRPVVLTGWTGHGMLVNSAAMRALRLDPNAVPPGGWLGRDALGRFDGRVYEYAQWHPRRALPVRAARLREVLAAESRSALQFGITSIQNMGIGASIPEAIAAWRDVGSPLRVRMIRMPMPAQLGETIPDLDLPKHDPARPRLTVSGTKWIVDGTPMERGAAMRNAYPGGGHGRLNFSRAELQLLLGEAFARGDQPLLHISGDAALLAVLDAMDAVAPSTQWRSLRPRIEHGEGLAPDLLERTAAAGMLLVQNPAHFMLPPPEVAYMLQHRLQPLASVAAAGIPLALGSDGPLNPWLNMMFASAPVSRPDEALSREQVLRAYTAGSAYAEFAEGEKGKLAPGYLADLAVLSQDVLDAAIPTQALPGTSSLLTIIGGEVAWRDPAF